MEEKKKRTNQKTKSVGNGEGSLYYSKTQEKWIFQYTHNGKRTTIKQKNNELARDFKVRVTKIKNDLNSGTYIEKSKDTVYNIIQNNIKQKLNDGICKGSTYVRDNDTLKAIENCCDNFIYNPIQNVTLQDIQESKEKMKEKYAQSVIDKMWQKLYKAFAIASSPSNRIIPYNIMNDENLLKPISNKKTRKIYPLTYEERKKLQYILDNEEKNHKYRNIVKMEWITGARIGEILSRTFSDIIINEKTKQPEEFYIHNTLTIDEDGNIIISEHTKTYNKETGIDEGERYFPIIEELKEILDEELKKKIKNIHDLIFWDYENNTFVSDKEVNAWLRRINKKYNISNKSLHNHRLRHDRATQFYESGMSLESIQYLLGHTYLSKITSSNYIDTSKEYAFEEFKKSI